MTSQLDSREVSHQGCEDVITIPLLYLPECREILWFSDGSAAAAGYGGYYGGYGGYGGGGYGEISTFVCEQYSGKTPRWISTVTLVDSAS